MDTFGLISKNDKEKDYSIIDIIKELMLDIASNQNSDGSIGIGEEINNTSYFVLAMVLYDEENKPYKNQINKAVSYLLNSNASGLEIYLPLKLTFEKDIYTNEYIIDKIQEIEAEDIQGNLNYLLNILKTDIEEFSQICFGKTLDKMKLIKYLFEEIKY